MSNKDRQVEIMQIIQDAQTVVVNSIDEFGYPVSRAMLTIREESSLEEMYFSTNTFSSKVGQFYNNSNASLYFHTTDKFKGVYLKGKMEVLFDQETKNRFWHDGDEQYYQFGKTDPNYCILKFIPIEGNYYYGLRIDWFVIKDGRIEFIDPSSKFNVPEFNKSRYEDYMKRLEEKNKSNS